MWSFSFSIYGTAVFFVLLFTSFAWVWIFGANVKHHYKSIKTGLNESAVRVAKMHYPPPLHTAYGFARSSFAYWTFSNRLRKNRFIFPFNAFVSDSVYHVANTSFELAFHRICVNAKRGWQGDYFFITAVFIAFFTINVSWSLIAGCWGITAIFGGLFFLIVFIELLVWQQLVNKAANEVRDMLLAACQPDTVGDIRRYCKYLKLRLLKRYAISFLQPFLELGQLLWSVGRNSQ